MDTERKRSIFLAISERALQTARRQLQFREHSIGHLSWLNYNNVHLANHIISQSHFKCTMCISSLTSQNNSLECVKLKEICRYTVGYPVITRLHRKPEHLSLARLHIPRRNHHQDALLSTLTLPW